MDRPVMPASNGRKIGLRYELGAVIGCGGMSTVYRAYDPLLDRHLAVKILNSRWANTSAARRRFQLEARTQSLVNHRGVPAVHDFGVDPAYLAMEELDGRSVREILDHSGPFEWRRAVEIAMELCDVLDACHSKGIVHRDVKPSNVFVCSDGSVKLIDFGIAKRFQPEPEETTAALLGTPSYISPEQLRGERATPASDLYGLGCLLHTMLTGEPPIDVRSPEADPRHIVQPAPPSSRAPSIPPALDAIVLGLLAGDPAERPASAAAARTRLAALDDLVDEQRTRAMTLELTTPIAADTVASPALVRRRSRWITLVGMAGAALALLATAVYASGGGGTGSPSAPAANRPSTSASTGTPRTVSSGAKTKTPPALPVLASTGSPAAALVQLQRVVDTGASSGAIPSGAASVLDQSVAQLLSELGHAKGHRLSDAWTTLAAQVQQTVAVLPAGSPTSNALTQALSYVESSLADRSND